MNEHNSSNKSPYKYLKQPLNCQRICPMNRYIYYRRPDRKLVSHFGVLRKKNKHLLEEFTQEVGTQTSRITYVYLITFCCTGTTSCLSVTTGSDWLLAMTLWDDLLSMTVSSRAREPSQVSKQSSLIEQSTAAKLSDKLRFPLGVAISNDRLTMSSYGQPYGCDSLTQSPGPLLCRAVPWRLCSFSQWLCLGQKLCSFSGAIMSAATWGVVYLNNRGRLNNYQSSI